MAITSTINDATVVASAYDTSGNGGRKLVRLSNGWLISAVYDSTNSQVKLLISKDNFATIPTQLCYRNAAGVTGFSLTNKGNQVYLIVTQAAQTDFFSIDATTQSNVALLNTVIDSGQTAAGQNSLAINAAGTELHAAWASKNSTYPGSFNIRYVKGTIAGDGSVTWGAVVQLTSNNTSTVDEKDPCIIIKDDNNPIIFSSITQNGNYYQYISSMRWNGSSFIQKTVFTSVQGATYIQTSPSAIFVPQSINGLANGRIWVSWHGIDATDTSGNNIRVSYSDDGGATWSAMQKLTSDNNQKTYATITCDKKNNIFILYQDNTGGFYVINQQKWNGVAWSKTTVASIPSVSCQSPSSLYDATFDFTSPLFIYKTSAKVGFYGTWTVNSLIPTASSSVTVPNSVTSGATANISWTAVPNDQVAEGEVITYQVDFLDTENNKWVNLADNVSTTTATVTIPQRHTTSTKFRVRAYDGYDYGSYKESRTIGLLGYLGATVVDKTVVASTYDTSGNGGRKLVRLSNGWLVAVTKTTDYYYFYVSKDNGSTFTQLCYLNNTAIDNSDISIVAKGTVVYAILGVASSTTIFYQYFDVLTVTNINIYNSTNAQVDGGQSALGNVSLAINEAKTELHAVWASQNSTYPTSYNIRYAKGTIAVDGSVTWNVAEQVTSMNSNGYDVRNPSMCVNGSEIIILAEGNRARILTGYGLEANTYGSILAFKKGNLTGLVTGNYIKTGWGAVNVYSDGPTLYTQGPPSSIFVPKSVNGLANGRIWVTWQGVDSVDTGAANIRVSYSDDNGITWSAMQKLTSGNSYTMSQPSITANVNNEIFVMFNGRDVSDVFLDIRQIKYSSGSWGSVSVKSNGATNDKTFASCLYDITLNFTEPLFIYKDLQSAKVGFYGTWTVSKILPESMDLGLLTDKSNIVTYTLATDVSVSNIIEKVNGVTTATRTNPTNGQSFTINLTQAQWDAIKYGKYADATGTLNLIDLGLSVYTFDKRLAIDADILSAVKAAQDSQNIFLPTVKVKLASVIRSKGGTVNNADLWDKIVSGLEVLPSIGAKRWARGTITGNGPYVVTGLAFKPSIILVKLQGSTTNWQGAYTYATLESLGSPYGMNLGNDNGNTLATSIFTSINNDGFAISLPVSSYYYLAIE